jgi:hypothetical protein
MRSRGKPAVTLVVVLVLCAVFAAASCGSGDARREVQTPRGNVLDCIDDQIAYTAGVDPPIAEAVGWDEPEQALAAYGDLDRPPGTPGVETTSDTEVVFVFTNPSGDRLGRVGVRLWPGGWFVGWAEKCGLEP